MNDDVLARLGIWSAAHGRPLPSPKNSAASPLDSICLYWILVHALVWPTPALNTCALNHERTVSG